MTVRARRRRAAVLLALALAAGGIAASRVSGREAALERQVGPPVPALVARVDIPAGKRVKAPMLALRQVPLRFAPPDGLSGPEQAVGQRVATPVVAGAYLTQATIAAGGADGEDTPPLARGQRSIEVAVAGGEALADAPPGTRVDVLVTIESRSGSGRTFLALQDVELLGVRPPSGGGGDDGAA